MDVEIFLLLVAVTEVFPFQQNDYRLIHEKVELVFYNTSYIRNPNYVLVNSTQGQLRFNVSAYLLQDLGRDITNSVQVYKFTTYEYREFPVYYTGNACDMNDLDTFGTNAAKYDTNFKSCPIIKGFYYVKNGNIDDSRFPPHAPRGRYMMDLSVDYKKTNKIMQVKWYVQILPTNPRERII